MTEAHALMKMEIESESKHLGALREKLRDFLERTGLTARERESVLVAMGEACTNAIRHSYGGEAGHKILVSAEDEGKRIVFKVRDFGKKIDLEKVQKPKIPPDKPGGLGIYFMRTIMDELEYNTQLPEGNELTLIKYKKGESSL